MGTKALGEAPEGEQSPAQELKLEREGAFWGLRQESLAALQNGIASGAGVSLPLVPNLEGVQICTTDS